MSQTHPAGWDVARLTEACEVRRQRRSGPGGQHRNKVETAIFLEHRQSGITAEASERRSQEQNRQVAFFRLRLNLAVQLRRPPASTLSELWQRRCRGRIEVSAKHDDFPTLLAEALDHLADHDWSVKSAAQTLRVSTSQLVRFLAREATALQVVNQQRAERGFKPLSP